MTPNQGNLNTDIKRILKSYSQIAIVGISDSPSKDSHQIGLYLQRAGYTVFPVNPKYNSVLGVDCYPDLKSISHPIEIVDIFRRPEYILPIVEEAIEIKAKVIWMQLGIENEEAAQTAMQAGLDVVMNHCIKIEHRNLAY
jgi:predicted CoA-binding protein